MIAEGRAHAALLAALHGAAFEAAERWDASAIATLLDMPGCFACVRTAPASETIPAGMALVRVAADEAELLSIAVLPSERRRGTGRALLGEALAEAARRSAARMFLEVSGRNAGAFALYRQCGFRQVGRRPAYYPDASEALVLAAQLS